MARNLLQDRPTDTVMPMSRSTSRAKRASTFAGIMPWTRWVPERSRNASSIDSGSTSGVSVCMAWRTSRPTRTYLAMSGRDHDRRGAERQGLEHRHRRAHAIGPRDVAGGRHHAALAAADNHRLVGEFRIVALLDGGVERVAVDMRQRQCGSAWWRTRRGEPHSLHRLALMSRSPRQSRQKQRGPSLACASALTARRAPNAGRPALAGRRRCWSDAARTPPQTPSRLRHRA